MSLRHFLIQLRNAVSWQINLNHSLDFRLLSPWAKGVELGLSTDVGSILSVHLNRQHEPSSKMHRLIRLCDWSRLAGGQCEGKGS